MRFSCAVTRRLRKNPGETIVSPGFFESFKRSSAAPSSRTIEIAAAEPTRMGEIRPEGIAAIGRVKPGTAVLVAADTHGTVGAALLLNRIPSAVVNLLVCCAASAAFISLLVYNRNMCLSIAFLFETIIVYWICQRRLKGGGL